MELSKNYKTYSINKNFDLFIEKYSEKPFTYWCYRYGLIEKNSGLHTTYGSQLKCRPNAKKCIESLRGMVY